MFSPAGNLVRTRLYLTSWIVKRTTALRIKNTEIQRNPEKELRCLKIPPSLIDRKSSPHPHRMRVVELVEEL